MINNLIEFTIRKKFNDLNDRIFIISIFKI
jgi:hypothetical protein